MMVTDEYLQLRKNFLETKSKLDFEKMDYVQKQLGIKRTEFTEAFLSCMVIAKYYSFDEYKLGDKIYINKLK